MHRIACVWIGFGLLVGRASESAPKSYDPMREEAGAVVEVKDLSFVDAKRKRTIPLRVYATAGVQARPVVLFSHGLGGSRENNAYVARHWAGRGYRVVVMQHAGSDSGVWKDALPGKRMASLAAAASFANFLDRTADVAAVLDQLGKWNAEPGNWLAGRLDMKRVGMSGHSFGAVTTEAVSGECFPGVGAKFTDPRIVAALAFSPSAPERGGPAAAFGAVRIPWLLMTGTLDKSPIGKTDAKDRLKVYPALPDGDKYELVLDGANHMSFSDRDLLGREARDPRYHKIIIAVSTAYWDAYLLRDPAAKRWLQGDACKALLAPADRWQWK